MVLSFIPFFLFVLSVSQIFYLSLISILPGTSIPVSSVALLHISTFVLSLLCFKKYAHYFRYRAEKHDWLVLLPYVLIFLIRFPLVYPTYDDLAAHFVWGDYANQLWQSQFFMPMNFLHYFYLPIDMNYTPFLYTIGVRLTIWLFYAMASLWFFSLYVRLTREVKTQFQRILLAILFTILPFIPHMLGVIGTLMGDYISLIFCLEALYLFIRKDKEKTFAVLMMITAILMKQSNSVFIAPILFYYSYLHRHQIAWKWPVVYMAVASLFFIRLYFETGNPLSGLFNAAFLSPLYSLTNFKQTFFGPESTLQLFLWPIIGQFTERYAEGIVSVPAKFFFAPISILGYCLSIWLMIRRRSIKYGILVLTYLLWSYLVGYARYYIALNLMTLILVIFDAPAKVIVRNRLRFDWIERHRYIILGLIFLGSVSSLKTDFSWRPHPSLSVAAVNTYYLKEYREGFSYVGLDTLPRLSNTYRSLFADYEAVISVNRGPVTFMAYMAYLQGLPVHDGVTNEQYQSIMESDNVSSHLKSTLALSMAYDKVIVLAERPYDKYIPTLKIYMEFQCQPLGTASRDPYLQRESYYTQIVMFSCERP